MENRKLLWKIMKLNREHRKIIEREIASLGIHPSQHHLLMYLERNGQSTQSSIAAAMEVSPSTIAVSLKKLEKGCYIEKEMDSDDNRFNRIVLTKKGEAVVLKSKQLFDEVDGKLFSALSEEEKETSVISDVNNEELAISMDLNIKETGYLKDAKIAPALCYGNFVIAERGRKKQTEWRDRRVKQYKKYIMPYLPYFLLAPILMLVEVVGEVVMPKLLANIINIGIPNGDTAYIVEMGLAMAGMAVLMMLGGVGGGYFSAKAEYHQYGLKADVPCTGNVNRCAYYGNFDERPACYRHWSCHSAACHCTCACNEGSIPTVQCDAEKAGPFKFQRTGKPDEYPCCEIVCTRRNRERAFWRGEP